MKMKGGVLLTILMVFMLIGPGSLHVPQLVSKTTKGRSPNNHDFTVKTFVTERTCWWNEPCKKEFQRTFRCRCPDWAYCRSLGRFYTAHCSFTKTGYIWEQLSPQESTKVVKSPSTGSNSSGGGGGSHRLKLPPKTSKYSFEKHTDNSSHSIPHNGTHSTATNRTLG